MPISHRIAVSLFAALVIALVLAPATPRAETARIERIEIFDAGIYCTETIGKLPEPNAPGGYVNIVAEPRLLKRTNQVPVLLGMRFGMRFTVVGTPSDARVDIRVITRMPAPGYRDPASGKTMLVSDYHIPGRVGGSSFRGNILEFDWELLPGVWTFEFWDNERMLASQRFMLAKPTIGPNGNSAGTTCAPTISSLTGPTIALKN
jgi:Domain of unknown function (DUF3859)